ISSNDRSRYGNAYGQREKKNQGSSRIMHVANSTDCYFGPKEESLDSHFVTTPRARTRVVCRRTISDKPDADRRVELRRRGVGAFSAFAIILASLGLSCKSCPRLRR